MIHRRDFSEPRVFALTDFADGSAFDCGFVGDDEALSARDQSDTADYAHADEFVFHPAAGKRRDFEEVRAVVKQHLDTLAWQQLASGEVAFDVLLTAAER